MTTKLQYLDLQTFISNIEDSILALDSDLVGVEDNTEADVYVGELTLSIHNIGVWVQNQIDRKSQDEVMLGFMGELKVVFDKYGATISTMAFEDGYGASYGEPGTGFLLTASLDGVTSTKEIKKAVIGSGDLV